MVSNTHKLDRLFRNIIAFLLISWLAVVLGKSLWTWLTPTAYEIQLPQVSVSSAIQKKSYAAISGDLFGISAIQVDAAKPLVKTKLKLLLKGVLPSDPQENSVAFISAQGRPDKMYRVGDSVASGVKLQAVYTDRVILKRGLQSEVLYFAKNTGSILVEGNLPKIGNTLASNRSGNGMESFTSLVRGKRTNNKAALDSQLTQDFAKLSPKALIDRYEKQFQNNPESLLSSAGLLATGSSYQVENGSPLTRVGLKAGDEIVSVNGQAVGDFSNDKMLGDVVRSQGVARIEISRNKRRFFVNYAVK